MLPVTLTTQPLPEGEAMSAPHGRPTTRKQNEVLVFVHQCLVLLSAILITLKLKNDTNSI